MAWRELAFASRHPDLAEELLLEHGASSVTLTDAADDPVLEPAPGSTPLWPHTITRGLFADDIALDAVFEALRTRLPDGAALNFEQRDVADADWVNAWLQHAQPLHFGGTLWVCPSGMQVPDPDAVIVELDPGLAFGTGSHPSTALCMEWLAANHLAGTTVLDYGCGSGILAIAALKLGAQRALAVDIDPQALTATQDNARRNAVDDRLLCIGADETDSSAITGQAVDVLLANILARPLITLAPMLAARVKLGGHLVLAGLLDAQAPSVREAYAEWFAFDEDGQRDGWSRVSGIRCR